MAATKDLGVLLGPEGPLARGMPRYESREGQVTMALRIQDAIERGRVLLCEAGTGTGKTLAYLVPAILSGKKVIVSTASRALQDQIVHKDLPLLRQHLGLAPRVSVMNGLSNYLCLRRSAEWLDRSAHDVGRSTEQGAAWDVEADAETRLQLATWKERTLTGDFAELERVWRLSLLVERQQLRSTSTE